MVLGVLFGSIEFDGSMVWEWDQETCTMLNNLGYISLQWFCIETTGLHAYNGSQAKQQRSYLHSNKGSTS